MDNKEAPCGNPDCNELGKMKCSGCASVSYCSQACQKKHWSSHKAVCKTVVKDKTAVTPASTQQAVKSPPTQAEIIAKLQEIKLETQKSFQTGNFPLSITHGLEALELARLLPGPMGVGEIIQLHLNLASAYMHTKNNDEAINHSNLAVNQAELGASMQKGNPQAIEVLTIALGSKAFTFLNMGVDIDQAYESAQKSLALAESIYPKNDPRLHKCLRALALVRDKQGETADAEKLFLKAYTILCLASGAHSRDAQMILDDLLGMLIRNNDFAGAERHASKNYQSLKDKTDEKEVIVFADAAARLASVLRRLNRDPEAELLIEQALAIREKHVALIGPMGVAFTLIQLAQVQEVQGKYGDELENKLMRALEIFGRVKGQNSPEVMNTIQSLRNVRIRRKELENAANGVKVEEVEDDEVASGETKRSIPSSSSSSRLTAQSQSAEELFNKLSFKEDDAIGRMMAANKFFETANFSYAEKLIAEAYVIFLRQNGPEHASTQAAKQNLGVVRNNSLNQLWMQVVTEEVLRLDESKAQSPDAAGDGEKKSEAGKASDESKQIDEYARLMSGAGATRPEDQWLAGTPSNKGCVVC